MLVRERKTVGVCLFYVCGECVVMCGRHVRLLVQGTLAKRHENEVFYVEEEEVFLVCDEGKEVVCGS